MSEPFSWAKFWSGFTSLTSWAKEFKTIIIIVGIALTGLFLWNKFFVKQPQNINKPSVIVTPFARVEKVDQTSTQVSVSEKPWEIGIGAGALSFDNKSGGFFGGWIRRKF